MSVAVNPNTQRVYFKDGSRNAYIALKKLWFNHSFLRMWPFPMMVFHVSDADPSEVIYEAVEPWEIQRG